MAIKAGVVLVNKYCKPDSKIYSGYVKYMNRDKAVRAEHTAEFDMFNEYMGNPEKTTGLFMDGKRTMTEKEIQEAKELFEMAQENGSFMWQTVISFDNVWLEKNGLYDSESKALNEDKIKELATNGVNRMLQNEKLDNAIWTAAIHYNTDNIHVHIATVEVEPMREKRVYQQYVYGENEKGRLVKNGVVVDLNGNPVFKEEMRGKFSVKSMQVCKQYIVNEILNEKDLNREINEIIRNRMARSVKNSEILKDPKLAMKLYELYQKLPSTPKNMWNYGSNIMQPIKKDIDELVEYYLENYQKEDYEKLKQMVEKQSERYKSAYGEAYIERDYKESKMEDLHKRMGNSILKVLRAYDLNDWNGKEGIEFQDAPSEIEKIGNEDTMKFDIYDLREEIKYLEKAARQGNEYAQYRLGSLYVDKKKEIYDLEKGIGYLKQAAEQGNIHAECKLGDVYVYEKNDINEGDRWYKKASDKGNIYAKKQVVKISFGMFSSYKIRRNWEYEKAIRALKKSFEKDYKAWKNILEHDREIEKRQEEQNFE